MDQEDKEILAVGEIMLGSVILGVSVGAIMAFPFSILLLPVGTMIFLHGMKDLGYGIKRKRKR